MKQRIQVLSLTDTGRKRKDNQDACAVLKKGESLLMIVADGVGGNLCGEIASRIVVETLNRKFEVSENLSPNEFLINVAEEANRNIHQYVANHPDCKGMATTLTAALVQYPHLHLLHVGDSRGYLLRKGILMRITEDHTLVQWMVRDGILTSEEAIKHPKRHVITNAIGVSDSQECDYTHFDLVSGDSILLCTDGLYDELSEREIKDLLLKCEPKEAINRLIDAANAAGGSDNISIVLAVLEGALSADTLDNPRQVEQ